MCDAAPLKMIDYEEHARFLKETAAPSAGTHAIP